MALKPIQILINAKDNASGVFSSLQAKVAAVGAAIASYFSIKSFAGVVEGAAEFEGAMSRVQAATGASGQELAALKKAAEDAGASTKFTSVEAAAALENLAKAGLSSKDAIAALPAVLNLAQAADIGLAESAEYVTKAVMGLGLSFEDAGRVADVLAKGANATNTSVTGLAQALSYAAPVANSLGLSLEGTVAIIGKFADAGIDASRAGTALNSILSQFADPASKFRRELAAAGITTNDFEKALHQLAAAGPAGSKAIQAVGLEAGPALRALLNQGMESLDELKGKLQDAAGSAAETARVMQDNLKGSMSGLASAWDTVKNVLGTPVLPVIKDGVDQLAAALRSAVSDGTIQRFGETIAEAFRNGLKWVREFAGSIDTAAIIAKVQGWADGVSDAMTRIGEYATNAGNIMKFAWGVMSAGANSLMTVIYRVAEAFAGVASNIQSGLAMLYEGMAKITFGAIAEAYKKAAAEIRQSAEATWAVSEAFAAKAEAAFVAVADGAQLARDGFAGLSAGMSAAAGQAGATAAAVAGVTKELTLNAATLGQAEAAQAKKTQADLDAHAAAQAHSAAIAKLREEYAAAIARGDLQTAAEKLQAINKALSETAGAGKDAAKGAQDAAAAIAQAFTELGVRSSAELKNQADNAKASYDTIKESGTATARDLREAFKAAAEAAIEANDGVAPSWVKAELAVRGYNLHIDEAGKSTLQLAKKGEAAGQTIDASLKKGKDSADKLGKGLQDAGEDGSKALEKIDLAAKMASKSVEDLHAAVGASWDTTRSLADQAAESNAAAHALINKLQQEQHQRQQALIKQQQDSNKYFREMEGILRDARMPTVALTNATWDAVRALEGLDRQQKAVERSSSSARDGLDDLRVRLLELDGDEEAVARARHARDVAQMERQIKLTEIEAQRARVRLDKEEAARLDEEILLLRQQIQLLDQIEAKEKAKRAQERQEREQDRRDEERRKQEAARTPAPQPDPAPGSSSAGSGSTRTVNLNLNLGDGRTLTGAIPTNAAGADTLEQLMRELERGQRSSGR